MQEGGNEVDRKIVNALEKIADAIRTLSWKESVQHSLNPMQIQILLFLLNHTKDRAGVSMLAREFNISKASISGTIRLLEYKRLVEKIPDAGNNRSFSILLTEKGKTIAHQVIAFDRKLLDPVRKISAPDKEKFFSLLSTILLDLHLSGVLPAQRICQTCNHYQRRGVAHYCTLLAQVMQVSQLQIDCAEHVVSVTT